jgi:hypothetical protein
VRTQESLDKLLIKLMDMDTTFWNNNSPLKRDSFQMIIIPLEAPIEGRKVNLFNLLGQFFSSDIVNQKLFILSPARK